MSVVVSPEAYIAPTAVIMGKVTIAEKCSVWYNAVIRGDRDTITIGEGSNIQDNCVVHEDQGKPVEIGKYVTVGHGAIVHGCKVGDNTLVGMNATIMNGAVVGKNCVIGAGALITENANIPDNSVVMGVPGKIIKQVSPEMEEHFRLNAMKYVDEAMEYLERQRTNR
ncbi:MAG: gamma carbonic anhydrase family protein [Lachnospiraceae bacterium]|jgi:carbonic anhydrase/acetyltransferase-like protein (isoleucine patch superfamily)|nr:gamma carbonic anhydrase family protein [Lachnospiraceae bacterium]